jgi:hypothetical protein
MASLNKIQQKQETEIYNAFITAIGEVKDQAVISEIANLIALRDVDGVIDLLQLSPATYEKLEESIRTTYAIGGATGAIQLGRIPTPKGTLVLRFNTRAPAAEKWLSELSSTRIVEISNETREVARTVLTRGLEAGRAPRSVALDLVGRIDPNTRKRTGGAIGLTNSQSQWAINAREELESLNPNYLTRALRDKRLDGAFKKAIESGRPMPAAQIDAAVSRLQARTLRYRGQNIARTESLSALSEGQNGAIQQALDVAELDASFTTKKWDSSGDSKTRPDHVAAENSYPDGIPFDQSFIVGGTSMKWPRDPSGGAGQVINCRCKLVTRVDFAGQAAKEIKGFG